MVAGKLKASPEDQRDLGHGRRSRDLKHRTWGRTHTQCFKLLFLSIFSRETGSHFCGRGFNPGEGLRNQPKAAACGFAYQIGENAVRFPFEIVEAEA